MRYAKPLEDLIEEFRKFPSIGPKSAQRMAFALLKKSPDQVAKFTRVIEDAKSQIAYCAQCFNLSSDHLCNICEDARRESAQICVVETVKDLMALERTHEYRGLYHVLGGVISPLDGISADDLNIQALINRVKELPSWNEIEIILAIGLSTEGEASMLYIKRLLDQLGLSVKVTRLAHGLPVGADLDYADEMTLTKALEARVLA
jgi:recombination protein RecR